MRKNEVHTFCSWQLLFWQHIDYYANKALSTVKYMKILGNSACGLISNQKYLLYRSCVLSIALYGFQLWFYNKMPLLYSLKKLNKIQQRAAIWILNAFCTFSFFGIEVIASLIPVTYTFASLVVGLN